MSDTLLKYVGLTKEQVENMMGKPKEYVPETGVKYNWNTRIRKAYDMIKAGGAPYKAAMSWNVPVIAITKYAYDNKLKHPLDYSNGVTTCKSYEGYKLAMTVGVSEAARQVGVSRRAIYSFAKRYNLDTPLRAR